jgi:hypothetical protein
MMYLGRLCLPRSPFCWDRFVYFNEDWLLCSKKIRKSNDTCYPQVLLVSILLFSKLFVACYFYRLEDAVILFFLSTLSVLDHVETMQFRKM